jgi:hypothetical protein
VSWLCEFDCWLPKKDEQGHHTVKPTIEHHTVKPTIEHHTVKPTIGRHTELSFDNLSGRYKCF